MAGERRASSMRPLVEREGLTANLTSFLPTCSILELERMLGALHAELVERTLPGNAALGLAHRQLKSYRLALQTQRRAAEQSS